MHLLDQKRKDPGAEFLFFVSKSFHCKCGLKQLWKKIWKIKFSSSALHRVNKLLLHNSNTALIMSLFFFRDRLLLAIHHCNILIVVLVFKQNNHISSILVILVKINKMMKNCYQGFGALTLQENHFFPIQQFFNEHIFSCKDKETVLQCSLSKTQEPFRNIYAILLMPNVCILLWSNTVYSAF